MRNVYIGFAIAIVVVIAGFALFNQYQRKQYAAAYATPTPGPNASAKPVELRDQTTVGKAVLKPGDVFGGGSGSPVDGIECQPEMATYHVHAHLALFDHGRQIAIPQFIGFTPDNKGGGCLYWIHTHDAAGIIHIEAPQIANYTLANLFHIWGEPLSKTQVATFKGPVTTYVNGLKYDGDPNTIPLVAHQQITLEVGTPLVPPPNYAFPPND